MLIQEKLISAMMHILHQFHHPDKAVHKVSSFIWQHFSIIRQQTEMTPELQL